MRPRAKDYARAAQRIEAALTRPAMTPDAVIRDFLAAAWDVLGVSGSC